MMRARKTTWLLCLFAAVLNLGGGPMAWARAMTSDSPSIDAAPAAVEMTPDCHQHPVSGGDAPEEPFDSRTPPCCETGSCACAVPHGGPVAMSVPISVEVAHGTVSGAVHRDVPSALIDDALRPPIR